LSAVVIGLFHKNAWGRVDKMHWIRSNLRFGACCALFALALQFALSFGHMHADAGVLKFPRLGATGHLVVPAAIPDVSAVPANPDSNGHAGDFCDICALIHLAGTLLPAASPALELPANFGTLQLPIAADHDLSASRPFSFRARAPPLA
jgi:hypothetical protein